jgi:hypothetical protein
MLDSKRNFNVSIFLRQFRSYRLEVIDPIRLGDCKHISAEKLRGLIKILPEQDEVSEQIITSMPRSFKYEMFLSIGTLLFLLYIRSTC